MTDFFQNKNSKTKHDISSMDYNYKNIQ